MEPSNNIKLSGIKKVAYSFEDLTFYLASKPVVLFLENKKNRINTFCDNSCIYFIMNEFQKPERDKPLYLGFSNGTCGTLEHPKNSTQPHFQKQPYLDDALSNPFAIYLLQELHLLDTEDFAYISHMIVSFGNHLIKKHFEFLNEFKNISAGFSLFKLKNIDSYIKAHIDKRITTTELAKLSNLSQYHFIRMFKRTTQQTPSQYIKTIKMNKAKELLLEKNHSIISIGLEVGFDNPSHFSQVFKTLFGMTPTHYKRTLSNSITKEIIPA